MTMPVIATSHYFSRGARASLWIRWWRWLWFIAFLGGLILVIRDIDTIGETPLQLGVIHRPMSTLLIAFLLIPWVMRGPTEPFRGILGLLTIFSLWRLVSILWSVNPLWTFYRSAEYLVVVTLTVYTVASLRNLEELQKWVDWIWGWVAILVASAWIGILYAPGEALGPAPPGAVIPVMLQGVFPKMNANGLGQLGGILALVGIARFLGGDRRMRWLLLITWGLSTMVLAQGRSGIAGFLVGFLLILILSSRIGLWLGLSLIFLILIVPSQYESLLIDFYWRGQSPTQFFSFSGRLYYWEFAWDNFIKESPLLGYGAFAGPRFLVIEELGYPTLSTLHNTWVETAVEIGLLGTFLLAAVVVSTWTYLMKKPNVITSLKSRIPSVEIIAILGMITVRSFFTTALISHNDYVFFLSIGCAEFLRRYQRSIEVCAHGP